MSYAVILEIPIEDVTPRDVIDEDGSKDRIIANIKSIQKVSDHKGGIERYIVHCRSRKKYMYYPGDMVKIRIKLTDLLNDL